MSHPRPVCLICLVGIAASFSLVLALGGVTLFFQIGPRLNHGRYKPDYYPLGRIVLIFAGICLLIAGCIATTTAVDLWKFKKRGRSLAMTEAMIIGIFTLLAIFSRTVHGLDFWIVILILLLSVETLVYLTLPTIRSLFKSTHPAQ